MYYKKKS